ncbi:MAG: class I tRNA ligase family protein, partial [Rhodobacter sp.]|nr:class I tRNA ligase family protein [Rhodobacter sp.]
DRYEARDAIVTEARDNDWLDGIDEDRHMVPHGDRSKVAIEPYLTDQWFVDAEKIVAPALDAVRDGEVAILPESDKKVYFHWLENIEPWCISRQLWWGHQVPVWYGPIMVEHADHPLRDRFAIGSGVQDPNSPEVTKTGGYHWECKATEDEAIEWFASIWDAPVRVVPDEKTFLLEFERLKNGQIDYVPIFRDPDVLDTWFSSGLWPIGTLGWTGDAEQDAQNEALQKYFPTSVLITGFDIIFFWVARMMMMQYAVVGQKPFGTVYVHALVRDEKGKKMSKSLGNVLDPLELIDEFGADAVRFTLTAMAAMGRDLRLSTQRVAGYRNFTTKLWNAVRFAEMNEVYGAGQGATGFRLNSGATQTANKWIIGEVAKTRETVDEALENYRFNDAANALYAFVWGKVCDWYVEFSKPLFSSEDAEIIAETRATMGWVMDQCLILLHPIMPFITEELWGSTAKRAKMLIHADWPSYQAADLVDETADREMNWVISLIDQIRSARTQMHVPAGLKIPMLQLELDAAGRAAWVNNQALIMKLARIDSLREISEMPKGAITIAVEGGTFCLPLADIIDVDEEIARLEKSLVKLDKEIAGLQGRLKNPKFAESAPPEVVEETRANAALREEEAATLRAALARLQELN